MRSSKALILLAVVTMAVVVAAMISRQSPRSYTPDESLLLPELLGVINDVVQIQGTGGTGSFSLHRDESGWRVEDKSDYPASSAKVREFLLGMTQLKRLEAKTQNPELYGKLGVADEGGEATESMRLRLGTGEDEVVAEVIMGKRAPSKIDPAHTELFVRLPEDPQVWLVEGALPDYRAPKDWVDDEIFKVDPQRIRQVQVIHPDGEKVTVRRGDASATDYELVEKPPPAEVESAYDVNSIATSLANLRLEDVKPASAVVEGKAGLAAELITFDGLRLSLQTLEQDDISYIQLKATFDPSLTESAAIATASDEQTAKPSVAAEPGGEETVLKSPDEVALEVERLNSRLNAWVYQLPDWRLESLAKRAGDLLKQPEEEQGEADKR
jgi:hypothetical protein